jgi:CSLREA domain-containing protein
MRSCRKGWFWAGLSLMMLLALLGISPVQADNLIIVTTTADLLDFNDGQCSLREAIVTANTNQFNLVGECAGGSSYKPNLVPRPGPNWS